MRRYGKCADITLDVDQTGFQHLAFSSQFRCLWSFLVTAYRVWGKVMFSQVCFILFTGGIQDEHPPPLDAPFRCTPHPVFLSPEDRRSAGGRYASYWNAFFFSEFFFNCRQHFLKSDISVQKTSRVKIQISRTIRFARTRSMTVGAKRMAMISLSSWCLTGRTNRLYRSSSSKYLIKRSSAVEVLWISGKSAKINFRETIWSLKLDLVQTDGQPDRFWTGTR